MGGGQFDAFKYANYSRSVATATQQEVYSSRAMDPLLDPRGVKLRESRDSMDNPLSTPIIIGLDVTGSMGRVAVEIAKQGLGPLFQGILDRKPFWPKRW